MTIPASRTSLVLALTGLFALSAGTVQAQPPRSISDCRAIEGELARYACYESLEEPAGAAAAPAGAAPQAPAVAPVAPPRPVGNLPVVRRPSLSVGDLTGESAAPNAEAPAATAVVRDVEDEKKPGLLRRMLPFGGDDDEDQEQDVAEVAPAAPAGASSEIDSFGRRDTGGTGAARVETNDAGRQELVDVVAAVEILGQNMIEVTLESGQVWRQMLSKRYPVNVGDTVTVRPTMWGSSYRLTSERISGFIQVQRVD